MTEKKFSRLFCVSKVIQISIIFGLQLVFYLILLLHPELAKQLYSNKALILLCGFFWLLMLFVILCFLCDFYHLRLFAQENHDLNKAAYLDTLTGIPNRHGLDTVFQAYDTPESFSTVGCLLTTITNLKDVNARFGHQMGDLTIKQFCAAYEEVGDRYGVVGRNSGNEYVLIMHSCTHEHMQQFIRDLEQCLAGYNEAHPDIPILVRHAYILNSEMQAKTFIQLLAATYNKLHS